MRVGMVLVHLKKETAVGLPQQMIRAAACGGIAAIAYLTIAGAAAAVELLPRVNPGDTIAVFGDSISTGNGYGYHAVRLLNEAHP